MDSNRKVGFLISEQMINAVKFVLGKSKEMVAKDFEFNKLL